MQLKKETINLQLETDIKDFYGYYEQIIDTSRVIPQEIRFQQGAGIKSFIWYRGYNAEETQLQGIGRFPTEIQYSYLVKLFNSILGRQERGLTGRQQQVYQHLDGNILVEVEFGELHEGPQRSFKNARLDVTKAFADKSVHLAHVEYEEGIWRPRKDIFTVDGKELVQPTIAALFDYCRLAEDPIASDLEEELRRIQKIRKED